MESSHGKGSRGGGDRGRGSGLRQAQGQGGQSKGRSSKGRSSKGRSRGMGRGRERANEPVEVAEGTTSSEEWDVQMHEKNGEVDIRLYAMCLLFLMLGVLTLPA